MPTKNQIFDIEKEITGSSSSDITRTNNTLDPLNFLRTTNKTQFERLVEKCLDKDLPELKASLMTYKDAKRSLAEAKKRFPFEA